MSASNATRLPVIIGVGQAVYRGPPIASRNVSPVGLAAQAAGRALADAGVSPGTAAAIDVIAAIRLFADSGVKMPEGAGGSNNFPRAVAGRIGANPARAIYGTIGGHTPQRLINELCEAVAAGSQEIALVVGAEATGVMKAAQRQGVKLDWAEDVPGTLEDRGFGDYLVNKAEARHRMFAPVTVYALIEQALRVRRGRSRVQHTNDMAALFAPFSEIAQTNPFAQFPQARSVDFLRQISAENYPVSDPYTKWLVAQDAVNQGAAVLITSVARADELGVPTNRRVFLHGYGDADDLPVTERAQIGSSSALAAAAKQALDSAEMRVDQIRHFDFYSCFPCAVFAACEAFGIDETRQPALTVTGGLPFFGGPGNAYSLNAVAAMVIALRANPAGFGVVSANGGYLSKESVGIYHAQPPAWTWRSLGPGHVSSKRRDGAAVAVALSPQGAGTIETYTVGFEKGKPASGIVVGRVQATRQRFVATVRPDDQETLGNMLAGDATGRAILVESSEKLNHFSFTA